MRALRTLALALFFAVTPVEARTARELFTNLDRYNEEGLALIEGLTYQQGPISLDEFGIRLDIPPSFYFLGSQDAYNVLVDGWGNPPSQAKDVAGMIMPAQYTPLDEANWGATLTFEPDGHVSDADAAAIDANALLALMRKNLDEANQTRRRNDYDEVTLTGWAAQPAYDKRGHKLTWARELAFASKPDLTINYSVRFLGRNGILSLNFVGKKKQFAEIKAAIPQVLKMAEFVPGARYEDFNPATDKEATFSITGLISGDKDQLQSWGDRMKTWALRGFLVLLGGVGIAATLFRLYVNRLKRADPRRRI